MGDTTHSPSRLGCSGWTGTRARCVRFSPKCMASRMWCYGRHGGGRSSSSAASCLGTTMGTSGLSATTFSETNKKKCNWFRLHFSHYDCCACSQPFLKPNTDALNMNKPTLASSAASIHRLVLRILPGPMQACMAPIPEAATQTRALGRFGERNLPPGFRALHVTCSPPRQRPSQFAAVSHRRFDAALQNFPFVFCDVAQQRGCRLCACDAIFFEHSSPENSSGCRVSPFLRQPVFVVTATSHHLPRCRSKISTRHILTAEAYSHKSRWAIFNGPLVNRGGKTKSQQAGAGEASRQSI